MNGKNMKAWKEINRNGSRNILNIKEEMQATSRNRLKRNFYISDFSEETERVLKNRWRKTET